MTAADARTALRGERRTEQTTRPHLRTARRLTTRSSQVVKMKAHVTALQSQSQYVFSLIGEYYALMKVKIGFSLLLCVSLTHLVYVADYQGTSGSG